MSCESVCAVDSSHIRARSRISRRTGFRSGAATASPLTVCVLVVCILVVCVVSAIPSHAGESDDSATGCRYSGPSDIAVTHDGRHLLILEKDSRSLRKVDVDGKENAVVLSLPIAPERMRLFPNGRCVAVVGGGVKGELVLIDLETWKIDRRIRVGHTPTDIVMAYDKEAATPVTAYVANRFGGDISVIDLAGGNETARWKAGREPIALALTPDGKKLAAVGHLPEDDALNTGISSRFRIFNTADGSAKVIISRSGAVNMRDLCLSPDGRYAFASGNIGHFEQIPTNVDGGWMNENALFALDMEKEEFANVFYLDDYAYGAGNPWGVTLSDCKRFLVVSHAGSCEITLMNLAKMIDVLDKRTFPYQTDPNRLNANAPAENSAAENSAAENRTPIPPVADALPLRLRIRLGLKGMRRAVMSKETVYVTGYFEDSIGRIVLQMTEPIEPSRNRLADELLHRLPVLPETSQSIPKDGPLRFEPTEPLAPMKGVVVERGVARLGPVPDKTPERRGEMLFHDAIVCKEHWQSCTSCHSDGRSDCLNWDLLNDGMGNPKNSKSMVLAHETPPCMAHGVRADAETAVRSGFHGILFIDLPEKDYRDVDAYLRALAPVESPYRIDGNLSPAARRGKLLFHDSRTGCSVCHPEPLFTDLQRHDVDTLSPVDHSPEFDTPTLIECWRTAPYLHDGRYVTLHDLIRSGKHVDTDGRLDKLTDEEIDDLVEYVLSL